MEVLPKRLLIVGSCWLGHTIPLLNLAKEFINQGYQVDYISFSMFKKEIEENGLTFIPHPDGFEVTFDLQKQELPKGHNLYNLAKAIFKIHLNYMNLFTDEYYQVLEKQKYEFLVYDNFSFWGTVIGKRLGLPLVRSQSSIVFTKDVNPYDEDEEGLALVKQFNEQYGVKMTSVMDQIGNNQDSKDLHLVYLPREFHLYPETLNDENYVFAGQSVKAQDFDISQKEKLIYVSLGTVFNSNYDFFAFVIEKFSETDFNDYQIIISMGQNEETFNHFNKFPRPDNITVSKWVNQQDVLRRASLFITHGGLNGCREAVAYNTPIIIYPQGADQFWIAAILDKFKAGTTLQRPIEDSFNDTLAEAIKNLSTSQANMRKLKEYFDNSISMREVAEKIIDYSQKIKE